MPVCATSTCVMSFCAMSSCVMSVCVMSICLMSICVMSSCEMPICVMSARVMSIFATSICVMSSCVMSICVMSTFLMSSCAPAGTHQHQICASPTGAATPNAIYTQKGAKPACQEDIHTIFLHLLLAQLPGTQCTHCRAPNPHARKTSTQNFRIS